MNSNSLLEFIEQAWDVDVTPTLMDYIAIPCQSPAFDPDWERAGHMDRAVDLMVDWSKRKLAGVPGVMIDVVRLPGRTPVILIDIPGTGDSPVLSYGHLDKQPPMEGWAPGRGAWTPVFEDDRLYGRGGADDGYAIFSAITAILALRDQNQPHARCVILIEACEESGSDDLPHYMAYLAPKLGAPSIIIVLDTGCCNYDQLWLTTSLRGQVAGTLTVRVLNEGMHSGDASGVVPSSFRIARHLLSRIEDPDTGRITPAFHVEVPARRRHQATQAAGALGHAFHSQLPLHGNTRPSENDIVELILNRAWRPQLVIIGIDGLPAVADAAAVMQPFTAMKVSLRLPPTLNPKTAAGEMKHLLESDPPYGCEVTFQIDMVSSGWESPALAPWLEMGLAHASNNTFGRPAALIGGGGGIPFLAMLGEQFPDAQFVATGVLGPQSNAHGPNEFLHIPTAKRVTGVVAHLLLAAASWEISPNTKGEN